MGYSLGANLLSKYLAEEGEDAPLVAACAISNPFDFTKGWKFIQDNLFGFYEKILADLYI